MEFMDLEALKYLLGSAEKDGVDCWTQRADLGNGNAAEVESSLFLFSFVRRGNFLQVFESGTHFGATAAYIGLALKGCHVPYADRRSPGNLYTIDPDTYDGIPKRHWDTIGVSDYITHVQGDSRTHDIKTKNPIDLAFYDGDHAAETLLQEIDNTAHLYNTKRVYLGYHDSRLDVREAEGIRRILKEKIPLLGYRHVAHFALRNYRGMDLIFLSNEEL